jgi:tRNA(Arg) A34 adenosine deaminase TadA
MTLRTDLSLHLPDWVAGAVDTSTALPSDEDKMRLAVRLARLNVEHRTGGPFGAAVFAEESGLPVSVGVNTVIPSACSVAHAETLAFALAQRAVGAHRLDLADDRFVLVSSAQPCSMCFGALPWSGIQRLVFGATREDVEGLTDFDEGPLPAGWKDDLLARGIAVTGGVLREEACAVLRDYMAANGGTY